MLDTTETTNHITDHSATSVKAMRAATHNILYTAVNSWRYADGEPANPMPGWKVTMIVVDVVLGVTLVGLETLAIKRFLSDVRRQWPSSHRHPPSQDLQPTAPWRRFTTNVGVAFVIARERHVLDNGVPGQWVQSAD